jgi:hypothetical protein
VRGAVREMSRAWILSFELEDLDDRLEPPLYGEADIIFEFTHQSPWCSMPREFETAVSNHE